MKTILATTYAVNPYKGSEDGMGWNFLLQIARFNKVIGITRENNRPAIERYMEENPNPLYANLTFLYFDLPYYMRFWKKGSRGAMLYYWMWQRGVVSFIKKQNLDFDLTHNINFHNDWTPSYLWKLGKPFFWGPVGHHPAIPSVYLKEYSPKYLLKDRLTWLVKNLFWKASPGLSKSVSKAEHIFCMNSSVENVLPLKPDRFSIMPSVASEDFGFEQVKKDGFTLLTAGRLVPLKGYDLSILAFAAFVKKLPAAERAKTALIVVGSGPEKAFYLQLAKSNGIEDCVQFIEWIDRSGLVNLYRKASVFIFPSHEGAGMVVSEAMSFGLPVICLNNCGPGEFVDQQSGIVVPQGDYEQTIAQLSQAIDQLYHNPQKLEALSKGSRARFETHFHWDNRGNHLHRIYQKTGRAA